jgi:trigger factor
MAVDAALVRLADNQQTLATVESVPGEEGKRAEKGEIAVVDFAGKIDGLAFPGGTASGAKLEVAGPGYIPGFTEQIEGMKVGEPCDIHVTFPNNYPATEFAGKDAIFTITIKTLYKKIRPEINDALAEKLGFENLQSLRQAMVSAMHKEYGSLSRMQIKRTLLDHLSEHTQCLLPDSMVEAEFKSIWDRFEDDRKAGRMDEDDARKDENTLKAEYRAIAERRVKLGLLFQEISRMHNIHVSQHELDEAINAQASRFGEHEARTITLIKEHKSLIDALHGPLLEDKVVDFILEQAMIVERTATVEELTVDCEDKAA